MVLPQRLPQEVPGWLVKLEKVSDSVELLLSHLERIEPFDGHVKTPIEYEVMSACEDASLPRFRDRKS